MAKQRRGRPRKTGPRQRNGHLKGKPHDSPKTIAAGMPHRRGLGDHASDPHAETELGRMLLRGAIDATQALAGETFGRLHAGYMATLDGPQALRCSDGYALHCPGCWTDDEIANCPCAMRKRVYFEAIAALYYAAGSAVTRLLSRVVIYEQQCPVDQLKALNLGLSVLASHFGLTKPRNSWHQNASSELRTPAGR